MRWRWPYHHVILPLSSRRDKRTEVRWGIADFRRRYGRLPEGMWLPETAVDRETLEVLAEEGIGFTVLAPHQVTRPPADGRAGTVRLDAGRSIAVFVYDGALSHDIAFGPLLRDAAKWERRLLEHPDMVVTSVATDGETYGHHHKFGDLGLAAVLARVRTRRELRVENFASALAAHPPALEIELVEPSSWSCAHGVERWACRLRLPDGDQRHHAAALACAAARCHRLAGTRGGRGLRAGPRGAAAGSVGAARRRRRRGYAPGRGRRADAAA